MKLLLSLICIASLQSQSGAVKPAASELRDDLCGHRCVWYVLSNYTNDGRKPFSIDDLIAILPKESSRQGLSIKEICTILEEYSVHPTTEKSNIERLRISQACIALVKSPEEPIGHYIVIRYSTGDRHDVWDGINGVRIFDTRAFIKEYGSNMVYLIHLKKDISSSSLLIISSSIIGILALTILICHRTLFSIARSWYELLR